MSRPAPLAGLMLATTARPDTGAVDPRRALQAARFAEEAGFDGVYCGDHLLHPHPMLESVVTLSAVAAVTQRVSLGPCVMLFALRNPVVLAKQLGTLAALAPGRLRIGVGVGGEYPREFQAVGVTLGERGRRTESVVREVRSLLDDGLEDPEVTVAPGAPGLPFLFAGWKEVSLRRAAALGDGWVGYLLAPESFARRREYLLRATEELGRSREAFTTGMLLPVNVDTTTDPAERGAAEWARLTGAKTPFPERLLVAGSAGEVIDKLHRYWELGCTELILAPTGQGGNYMEQLERLAEEVLPEMRRFGPAPVQSV